MDKFMIPGRVVIITGGAGLMGYNHAEAVLSGGGVPVLLDISEDALVFAKQRLLERFPTGEVVTYRADITDRAALETVRGELLKKYGHIDALINNAANNPKMEGNAKNMGAITFENFPLAMWAADITVGLTGSLLCSQVFGAQMAKQRSGAILNISSDLGVIAPDQRIYRKPGLRDEEQTVKPVTYSVIKHGLIGLTKYVATYWAEKSVRCNALCPAGVENGQDEGFIRKLTNLVPMGRMATKDEYQSTVLYMISDASAYMTGATVIVDGGRTCW
jgi:NAD(P)-dependent dehydrogenase (short-subunit alcohol dehydrogenase family)